MTVPSRTFRWPRASASSIAIGAGIDTLLEKPITPDALRDAGPDWLVADLREAASAVPWLAG